MLVILQKKPGTNQWEYPDDTKHFSSPEVVDGELHIYYYGTLSLPELSKAVSYKVVEYKEEQPKPFGE